MFDSRSSTYTLDEVQDYLLDRNHTTLESFSSEEAISASVDIFSLFKSSSSIKDDEPSSQEEHLNTDRSPQTSLESDEFGNISDIIINNNSEYSTSFGWIDTPQQEIHSSIALARCNCPSCCGANVSSGETNTNNNLNTNTSPFAAVSTGDYRLDALLKGTKWSGNTITYSFYDGGSYYGTETVGEVSNTIKNNVRYIIENLIEPLVNVNFVEVSDAGNNYGQIRYMLSSGQPGNSDFYAYAYLPSNSAIGGDVHLNPNRDNAWTNTGFQRGYGSHGFETLMHETLHALGLKHPGNYNGSGTGQGPFLPYGEDNITNTIMSYNNSIGNSAASLMAYDVMALQYLYGARSHNAGNTTYTFDTVFGFTDGNKYWGSSTTLTKVAIWDISGNDTLNFSKLGYDASGYIFNLNQGGMLTTRSAYNGSSYKALSDSSGKSYQATSYGTALGYNMTIENAIATSSKDIIVGNNADNILYGLGGNDYLVGGSGSDSLTGGSGSDRLVGYSSGTEYDVLTGGSGNDVFVLGNSSNAFYQGNGYAKITDFNGIYDYIEVKGSSSQYSLGFGNWVGNSAQDTAIFYGNDAIAVVQDNTNVSINNDFLFV